MNFNDESEGIMRLLIMATTLRGSYDEWICKPNFKEVLNVNTNATCIKLKNIYHNIDDKTSQSIALAVLAYTYLMCFILFNPNTVS